MYKLKKPNIDQAKVIEDCLPHKNSKSSQRTARIRGYIEDICDQAIEYDKKANKGQLYLLKRIATDPKSVQFKEDMEYLYNQRFAGKSKTGEKPPYYSMLISNISICPFCGNSMNTSGFQIDHFMPKCLYPVYAVSPINLVPCCSACNNVKGEYAPDSEISQLIHPYYDDFNNDTWIKAKLVSNGSQVDPVFTFEFYTDYPSDWTYEKKERANTHIRVFDLKEQFTLQSNIVISNCKDLVSHLLPLKDQNELFDTVKEIHDVAIKTSIFGAKNGYYMAAWNALLEKNDITNEYWKKMWMENCQDIDLQP